MSSGNKRVKSLDLPKSKIQENSNPGSYEKGFHIAKSVPILLSKLEIDDIPGWNAKVKDYFVCIRFIFSDWRGYCTCPDKRSLKWCKHIIAAMLMVSNSSWMSEAFGFLTPQTLNIEDMNTGNMMDQVLREVMNISEAKVVDSASNLIEKSGSFRNLVRTYQGDVSPTFRGEKTLIFDLKSTLNEIPTYSLRWLLTLYFNEENLEAIEHG